MRTNNNYSQRIGQNSQNTKKEIFQVYTLIYNMPYKNKLSVIGQYNYISVQKFLSHHQKVA